MKSLRWGILGTGNIAGRFAAALTSSATGTLELVASRSEASAAAFTAKHGARTCLGYETLLADPAVDAVYIATPHPAHARWCLAAARAGKHILCEKPATMTFAEADAVINEARANGVFFMEAFMYRCHPQTARMLEIIRSGRLGEVRYVEAAFSFDAGYHAGSRLFANALGGGGILDVGCYTTSMARLIAGAAAGLDHVLEPVSVKGSAFLDPDQGTDLFASALLEFPGGLIASVCCGVQLRLGNQVSIHGRKGSLTVTSPWFAGAAGAEFHLSAIDSPEIDVISTEESSDLYHYEIDCVARFAEFGEAAFPAMTHADTLGNMKTLDAWRSAAGVVYACDRATDMTRPLSGLPLRRNARTRLPEGWIPGLEMPVSRIVMGGMIASSTAGQIVLDDYFEQGGNAFDTAYIYGNGSCDRALGHWLATRGIRNEAVVIAKGAHTPFCNPIGLTEQLNLSLDALGLESADIYIMHRDNEDIPVGEFIDVLNRHQREGRITTFGCSNWSLTRLREANAYAERNGLHGFRVWNNQLSLARMVDPVWAGCLSAQDAESREWLKENQFALLAWSSQARGFFSDRTPDEEMRRCWFAEDNQERKRRAARLATAVGCEEINVALAWVLSQPFPVWTLVGPQTVSELRSTLKAADLALTAGECDWLNLETDTVPPRACSKIGR